MSSDASCGPTPSDRLSLDAAMDSDGGGEDPIQQALLFPACTGTCLKEQPDVPCLRNDAEMVLRMMMKIMRMMMRIV